MTKNSRPTITHEEIVDAVSKRSGLPFKVVHRVLDDWQVIIRKCIMAGVQAQIGKIGIMGWKIKAPHYGVVYYDHWHGDVELPPRDVPGFRIPAFDPTKSWKKELRKATEFWEKEENKE